MHPAGGEESVDESGNRIWIPNKESWAKPEGSQAPPEFNPLELGLDQVASTDGGVNEQHVHFVNRVGLHDCNGYCLRYKRKK